MPKDAIAVERLADGLSQHPDPKLRVLSNALKGVGFREVAALLTLAGFGREERA